MLSSPLKAIQEHLTLVQSNNKKRSSKLIQRIKFNQNLNKPKLLKSNKRSDLLIRQPRPNDDPQLQNLKFKLEQNNDLINLPFVKQLILLIFQLNGSNLNNNRNSTYDPENITLTIMKEFLKLFEKYNFFFYFFCHYRINNNIILKIIPYIKYEFFEKNELICKEGEPCSKFYFLLKGKISFTKKSINGGKAEIFTKEEEGFHFGEADIINNRNNNYTVLCEENCYLIYIEKEIFISYIQDKYVKVESDIKSFLMDNMNNYMQMQYNKLESFTKTDIKLLFFRKNDVVAKKGEETKYLYFIYDGEVNIKIKDIDKGEEISFINQKKKIPIEIIKKQAKKINYKQMVKKEIKKDEESKNDLKLEMTLNKYEYNIMTTLTKGSFIGLEISTGINCFKYNYVCKSNFASIFEINIENLGFHLKELMINLIPYFFELEEKIQKQIDKITLLNYKTQPKTFLKIRSRNRDNNYNKYIDSLKIEENEKTLMKQLKKLDNKFDKNEAGFIKINNNNTIIQKQKNILINKLRYEYFKSKTQDLFLHNLNQEINKHLKYKNVKMFTSTNKNKNNSNSNSKKRPLSSFIPKFKKGKRMAIFYYPNQYNIEKFFSKFKQMNMSTTSSDNFSKNNKNFNISDKEKKFQIENKITSMKNKRMKFSNYIKLQKKRNRNNINEIKRGLSINCKTLVKKVNVKYQNRNANQFQTFINLGNKCKNRKNSYENFLTFSKIIKNKFISKSIDKEQKKKIIRYKEKKLDFYDTGIFDMPLAIQLGANSQTNILLF